MSFLVRSGGTCGAFNPGDDDSAAPLPLCWRWHARRASLMQHVHRHLGASK
jgi:hypothetical protein